MHSPPDAVLSAALGYASRGWPVLPCWWPDPSTPTGCACYSKSYEPSHTCDKPGKHPHGILVAHGVIDATTEETTIRKWFRRAPRINLGVAAGPTSFTVLDVDGEEGRNSLAALEAKHSPLPATPQGLSGGGGRHVLFQPRSDLKNAVRFAPGLDIRTTSEDGKAGYIVVAPSVHASGRTYEWDVTLHPDETPLAPMPEWLVSVVKTGQGAVAPVAPPSSAEVGDKIVKGARNDTLASIAGTMRRKGMTLAAIEAALLAENAARFSPPLADAEVRAIAASIGKYRPSAPGGGESSLAEGQPVARPILVRLETVTPRKPKFLSKPRIPLGLLTLIAGDGGVGKSTVAYSLAAAVTRGVPLFGDSGPTTVDTGPVLLMQAEDGIEDTVVPRLIAAGADRALVRSLTGTVIEVAGHDGKPLRRELAVTMADVATLREAMREVCPRLVVLDPISAFLGAAVDAHRANEVRPVLAGLARLAEEWETAIVLVGHLNKGGGTKAIYRVLSSIDFVAAARSVLFAAKDPRDAGLPTDSGRRVLLHVKSNLARSAPPIGFDIVDVDEVSHVVWTGSVEVTEDQVFAAEQPHYGGRGRRSDDVSDFLRDALAGGERPARAIYAEAAARGIKVSALKRVSLDLVVEKRKDGKAGPWLWRLPSAEGDSQAGGPVLTTPGAPPSAPSAGSAIPGEESTGHALASSVPSTGTALPFEGVEGAKIKSSRDQHLVVDRSEGTEGSSQGVYARARRAATECPPRSRVNEVAHAGALFATEPDVRDSKRLRQEGGRA